MFIVVMRDIADVEPFEHQPGATNLARGSAAVLTAGSLAKCGATTKPSHIIMGLADSNGLYPCIRVQPTTVFETTSTAAVASAGTKVTLNTDALSVTATATDGVFTVDSTENKANGIVRGRFL